MKNAWFEWGVGAAAAVLVGTGLVYVGVNSRAVDASPISDEPDPRELIASYTSALDASAYSSEMKRVSVLRNETLSSVLDRIGASREEANGAVYAASQLLDLRGMRPGDDVTAWMETEDDGDMRLTTVKQTFKDMRNGWYMVAEERAEGDIGLFGEKPEIPQDAPVPASRKAKFDTIRLGQSTAPSHESTLDDP